MREVAYQNKDITSKLFAESLKEKSFAVYGVDTPRVKEIWPTNLPRIAANELRMDNLFLLEDNTLAIFDYESQYTEKSKVKYINYIMRVYEKYRKQYPEMKIHMIVLYTSDVEPSAVSTVLDIGCLQIQIKAGYLSQINCSQTYHMLKLKIEKGEKLSDEDIMLLTVLPLTIKGRKKKEHMIEKAVKLAKQLENEEQKVSAIAGIVTFADKIISKEYSNQLKEWIRMTKVGRLFEEEKLEAVKVATVETINKAVKKMVERGDSDEAILEIYPELDKEIIRKMRED